MAELERVKLKEGVCNRNDISSIIAALGSEDTPHEYLKVKTEHKLPKYSYIELRDLQLAACIGTYGPNDVVPNAHLLDLTMTIAPDLVLIAQDDMAHVFDYDPLIKQIDVLARDGRYETQERLITRIAEACAAYPVIKALDICLRKGPVLSGSGSLGVRLVLDAENLAMLR
jgi:dihydroneopterin aldolase